MDPNSSSPDRKDPPSRPPFYGVTFSDRLTALEVENQFFRERIAAVETRLAIVEDIEGWKGDKQDHVATSAAETFVKRFGDDDGVGGRVDGDAQVEEEDDEVAKELDENAGDDESLSGEGDEEGPAIENLLNLFDNEDEIDEKLEAGKQTGTIDPRKLNRDIEEKKTSGKAGEEEEDEVTITQVLTIEQHPPPSPPREPRAMRSTSSKLGKHTVSYNIETSPQQQPQLLSPFTGLPYTQPAQTPLLRKRPPPISLKPAATLRPAEPMNNSLKLKFKAGTAHHKVSETATTNTATTPTADANNTEDNSTPNPPKRRRTRRGTTRQQRMAAYKQSEKEKDQEDGKGREKGKEGGRDGEREGKGEGGTGEVEEGLRMLEEELDRVER